MTGGLDLRQAHPLAMGPQMPDPAQMNRPPTPVRRALWAVVHHLTAQLAWDRVRVAPIRDLAAWVLVQAARCPACNPRLARLAAG